MTITETCQLRLSTAALMPIGLVVIEVLLAPIIAIGLLLLGADGTAWILGGVIAGAIVAMICRAQFQINVTPNRNARKIGQLLVGLAVGFSVQHTDLSAIAANVPIFVMLTGCLVLGSLAVAALYTHLQQTDWLTAMLATTPGNIGVMASIAADYGSNPAIVSLVQLIRFTAVTSTIPLLSQVSHPTNLEETLNGLVNPLVAINISDLTWLGFVLVIASCSARLSEAMKIPVPALMGPLIVGTGFNALVSAVPFLPTVDFNPPVIVNLLGQILLGTTIGEYWGMNPNLGRGTIARATVPAALTLLMGLGVAGIAKLLTSWDWLTCLLVTAPGGSPEMIWIALSLHQDVELVTVGHLLRLLILNALLPVMIALATSLERSRHDKVSVKAKASSTKHLQVPILKSR